MKFIYRSFVFFLFLTASGSEYAFSQQTGASDTGLKFKKVAAGPQYKRSRWHQFLWGKNYRKEWSTPVQLPMLMLKDTLGGLSPVKEGGGHQTSSLHLENKNGDDYTIRSIDKRLGKVLPESFRGTFIEHLVNDEVSMSHPYAAVTVPVMAKSAGIYHTTPQYVYVPKQDGLDSFNNKYGNAPYLFEQRLKGDWKNDDNLGNFEKYYSTDDVLEKIHDKTDNRVDQKAFAKARLFDMFLADWDRHEEQWAWGIVKNGDQKVFTPIPQDRDQVYFKHNGVLLDAAIYASNINYFQSFKDHISNVKTLNYEERGLDRVFTNELKMEDWIAVARQLQQSITDNVIEEAVKKFPPEVYKISGKQIIADLKARRKHLAEYAKEYYLFLSKEVEIVGTTGSEYFEVKRLNDNETAVSLYNITKEGIKENKAYYSRTFLTNETNEIRLFGLSGNDVFTTDGRVNNGMKIRIIGGYEKDSILVNSTAGRKTKTFVYDGHEDYIKAGTGTRLHISNDSAIHAYQYRDYIYDLKGTNAALFYSLADRIFVGFGYGWTHHHWRKLPYVFNQSVSLHYSITQQALSFTYAGIIPNTIGKWNLALLGNYDFVRWTNFYGLGNESLFTTKDKNYNRMRSREGIASVGLNRKTRHHFFEINGFMQTVKILSDENRYISKNIAPTDTNVFDNKSFFGAAAGYSFSAVNDIVVPTKGITFSGNVSYTQNIKTSSQSFWKYGGVLQLYQPLVSKFSLAVSGGVETVNGNPEFYQYPVIGGGQDLRGFQLQRFYGKTAFYNSNELRFISKVRSYIFNGKAGLLAFVDDGRVWMPLEKSDSWHVGYGGGIVLVPFNIMYVAITYGISNEDKLLQLRLNMKL